MLPYVLRIDPVSCRIVGLALKPNHTWSKCKLATASIDDFFFVVFCAFSKVFFWLTKRLMIVLDDYNTEIFTFKMQHVADVVVFLFFAECS